MNDDRVIRVLEEIRDHREHALAARQGRTYDDRALASLRGSLPWPADGKVTDLSTVVLGGSERNRISIFLSVFDVHVNRSPIAGVIRDVRYQPGKFLNAMNSVSAEHNEQNVVTVEGNGHVVFKQIAGLLARRIVFTKKVGDRVARGERVGMIKFGSRVDVLLDPTARLQVRVGDRVKGGSSVLAYFTSNRSEIASPVIEHVSEGAR